MKFRSMFVLAALLAAAQTASSATLVFSSGSLEAALVIDSTPAISGFDIRGALVVDVFDPGYIGSVLLSDSDSPPLSGLLLALDSTFTQGVLLTFDSSSAALGVGPGVLIPATPTPFGAVTDAALASFLTPLLFGFSVTSITPDPASTGFVVGLLATSVVPVTATPEPGSALFAASAFVFLALRRAQIRRRSLRS